MPVKRLAGYGLTVAAAAALIWGLASGVVPLWVGLAVLVATLGATLWVTASGAGSEVDLESGDSQDAKDDPEAFGRWIEAAYNDLEDRLGRAGMPARPPTEADEKAQAILRSFPEEVVRNILDSGPNSYWRPQEGEPEDPPKPQSAWKRATRRIFVGRTPPAEHFDPGIVGTHFRDFIRRIAACYHPEAQDPLLTVSPAELALFFHRVSLDLMLHIESIPTIPTRSIADLVVWFRRGTRTIQVLSYMRYVTPLMQFASGVNPIFIGSSMVLRKVASELTRRYGRQALLSYLIGGAVEYVGIEAMRVFSGLPVAKDDDVLGRELVAMHNALPPSAETTRRVLEELSRIDVRSEYDRLRLVRAVAGRDVPPGGVAIEQVVRALPARGQERILTVLAEILRDAIGAESAAGRSWHEEIERRFGRTLPDVGKGSPADREVARHCVAYILGTLGEFQVEEPRAQDMFRRRGPALLPRLGDPDDPLPPPDAEGRPPSRADHELRQEFLHVLLGCLADLRPCPPEADERIGEVLRFFRAEKMHADFLSACSASLAEDWAGPRKDLPDGPDARVLLGRLLPGESPHFFFKTAGKDSAGLLATNRRLLHIGLPSRKEDLASWPKLACLEVPLGSTARVERVRGIIADDLRLRWESTGTEGGALGGEARIPGAKVGAYENRFGPFLEHLASLGITSVGG